MATHTVTVNADGSFSPMWLDIHGDDLVEWHFHDRFDTVIPARWDGPFPAICSNVTPYDPSGVNDFTGPMPVAPSGIFALGPVEKRPRPPEQRTLTQDQTWESSDISGVFVRLLWNEVHVGPDEFVWDVLDTEMDKAVANDKLFSVSFKAGHHGTPDWLFTDAGVPPLDFQDGGSGLAADDCGTPMRLGSPCHPAYQGAYFALLREVAAHIRSRNAWYRALGYVKPSGANLFSHENRLPNRAHIGLACVNNAEVWATQGGFTPDALLEFYSLQTAVLAEEFPEKSMSYALIQAGFPQVSNDGRYEGQPGTTDLQLPRPTVLTESILTQGRRQHGTRFVVQHNGLGPTATPNKWVRQEAAVGQITGFQTNNQQKVCGPQQLEDTIRNALDNSDAVFLEIYEARLHEVANAPQAMTRPLADYAEDFHERRRIDWAHLGDPYPLSHRHRFRRSVAADTGNEIFHYIHGSKCGVDGDPNYGAIKLLP
jgi:hypothetical protein